MTRGSIQHLINELKNLATTEDLSEYSRAKDQLLERSLPALMKSKKTRPLAEAMKSMLKIGYYIPSKNEASQKEIDTITRKAREELTHRIDSLEGMLTDMVRSDLPLAVLAMLFLCGGIFALVYFNSHMGRARESAHWPMTDGRLLKSEVAALSGSTVMGSMGTRSRTTNYRLDVEYEYSVSDTLYRGRNFSFEPATGNREYWEAKARQYQPGTAVRVYYDPVDPAFAILERGDYKRNFIFIFMGLIFAGTGALFLARVIRFRYY